MTEGFSSPAKRFIVALIVGAILGILAGTSIRARMTGGRTASVPEDRGAAAPSAPSAESPGPPDSIKRSAAWQYAMACRDGDGASVLDMTYWMKDRLAFVERTDGADAVPVERDRMVAELETRTVADNRLADEGVEDRYVFSPGAEIVYDSVDAGREGLDGQVARRTWFRVSYPTREKALMDRDGVPIRALRVGVNVSTDGYVLKGNVIGNLDIDWESIMYDWPLR